MSGQLLVLEKTGDTVSFKKPWVWAMNHVSIHFAWEKKKTVAVSFHKITFLKIKEYTKERQEDDVIEGINAC